VDAAAEVQGDGEGGEAGPFCPGDAGPLTYCMDFDSVDGAEPTLGTFMATASIVTGTFVSPPKSLFVSLTDQSANGGYSISFPVTPTTVRLEFQVRAAVLGQGASLSNVGLSMDSTWRGLTVLMNPRCNFHVEEYFSLADGGFEQNDHPGAELAGCDGDAGAWHHVVLTLTVDDSSQQYTSSLTVDEQVFEDNQPLSLTWIPGEVGLSLGVTYADGNGSRFYFDNIRVDFTL